MLNTKITLTLIVVYALTLGITYLALERIRLDEQLNYDLVEEDPDRNEESTPRSFVLPATPAVAFAQETKSNSDADRATLVVRCIVALRARGFEIVRDTEQFNVPLVKALLSTQRRAGITETGKLDDRTAAYLGCSNAQ